MKTGHYNPNTLSINFENDEILVLEDLKREDLHKIEITITSIVDNKNVIATKTIYNNALYHIDKSKPIIIKVLDSHPTKTLFFTIKWDYNNATLSVIDKYTGDYKYHVSLVFNNRA